MSHSTQRRNGASYGAVDLTRVDRHESWADVTPADLVSEVMRRLPSVLFVTLLVTALVVGALLALPNQYLSDGMMYVRLGRGALVADPTAQNAGAGGISIQENRSSEVLSIAEMMGSREIAQRVVDIVGADAINQPRTWIDRAQIELDKLLPARDRPQTGKLTDRQYEQQLAREAAVKKVRKWLHIQAPKNGYTVAISTKGPEAFLVKDITQAVMDQYKRYHVEAHRSDGSLEFFVQQVAESKNAAIKAREDLQRARSDSGWMSVESAESTMRDRIINLEIALDESESQYAETKQRASALKDQLALTKEWIPTEVTKGIANLASDTMRSQFYDQQVDESEQLATLKPNHPKFRLLQEKMTRNEEIVADEDEQREETRESLNPIWQQLESQHAIASASAAGLKSKCQSLRESLQRAQEDLLQFNRDAVTLAKLKWHADIAEQNHKHHAKSLEEARIAFELDRKHMSDVSVIQDATLNLKKVSPPRALLAMIGGCLGLALGIVQALLRQEHTITSTAGTEATGENLAYGVAQQQRDEQQCDQQPNQQPVSVAHDAQPDDLALAEDDQHGGKVASTGERSNALPR